MPNSFDFRRLVANEKLTNMYPKLYVFLLVCTSLWIFVVTTNTKIRPIKKKFVPRKSSCKLKEICEKAPVYPVKAIMSLLKKNKKKFEFLAGTVMEPLNETTYRSPEETKNLCTSRKYSVVPKLAFDTKQRLKYIVNVKDFKQLVTYETCQLSAKDKDKSCYGNEHWPNDYETVCQQAYTVIRLLSVSHSGKMEYAYFPVPSNCVCAYIKLNSYDYK